MSSSYKLSPHFISQMKFDLHCLSPGEKLALVVLSSGAIIIYQGLYKIIRVQNSTLAPRGQKLRGCSQAWTLFIAPRVILLAEWSQR